jgi:hypothetical protein
MTSLSTMAAEPKQRVMQEFDTFMDIIRQDFEAQLKADSRRRWDVQGTIEQMSDGQLAFYSSKMDEMQDAIHEIIADEWENLYQSIVEEQDSRDHPKPKRGRGRKGK